MDIEIIDVWAEWCAPCKRFAPIFETLKAKYPEIHFLKINVEEDPSPLRDFNIKGIPAIIFVVDGEVDYLHMGILTEVQVDKIIADIRNS